MLPIAIHLPTLVIAAAIANMAMAIGLGLAIHGQPAALNGSLPVWTRGMALLSLGWFLIALRGKWPDLVALVGANSLLGWGLAECCDALRRFDRQTQRRRLPYLLTVMIVLVSLLFSYVWPDRFLRLTINTSLLAIIFAVASQLAWRTQSSITPDARSHRLVSAVFALAFAVLAARVVLVLSQGREAMPSINEVNFMQGLFYITAALGPAVATLGFALMCNERLGAELERLANLDALTGLHNRRKLEQLAKAVLSLRHQMQPVSLVLVDADHFKNINDRYGHAAGDAALRQLAAVLDEATGTQGSVGRFGGEEFIILLPGLLLAEAASLADRIRQRIHTQPLQWGSQAIEWSISAGVVEYGDQDPDFDALVRRADVALYRAKGEGRNRVVSI